MMNCWMTALSEHFRQTRVDHPDDRLIIVFDIDGTILDMRHMILYVLNQFDRQQDTSYFQNLTFHDIDFHEDHVSLLLERLSVPPGDRKAILSGFEKRLIAATAFPESQRPFHGVFDVIRWFQNQRRTFVGLNTGRPDALCTNTLFTLNAWGRLHDVSFTEDLLFMKSTLGGEHIPETKVSGIEYFRKAGYNVFAVVDNEPENLRAIGEADPEGKILLLHADTIFKSDLVTIPDRAAKGRIYDLRPLGGSETKSETWRRPDDDEIGFRRTA